VNLPDDLPVKQFRNVAAWNKWLSAHLDEPGAWLKIAKKGSGATTLSFEQAIEVALCHGWIDGLRRGLDEVFFLQRFTPRKPRSLWSKINVAKVERLIEAGRMLPAGLREVEAAKTDGRWQAAYDGAARMQVPDDLANALAENRKAQAFFEALDRTNRYAFCFRVHTAVKPETRRARIEKFVGMLARGEKLHA
jgi:uncharacterized protein YdeI (YjbR/CyaY-like superfamily)